MLRSFLQKGGRSEMESVLCCLLVWLHRWWDFTWWQQ